MPKKIHPDYNQNENSFYKMVELNLIRDTLLDDQRREDYNKSLIYSKEHTISNNHNEHKKRSIYSLIRELFIYRCRLCDTELNSTWQGYCLFHYLEVTGQLNNPDHTFTYHGHTFRWKDPEPQPRHNKVSNNNGSRLILFSYLIVILTVIILIMVYLNELL